ncbi:MAG: HAD family hydrolase [Methanomicrobiales archaeon]|nr:HAD family hydrolase [Methanomicrobiales archaeon]
MDPPVTTVFCDMDNTLFDFVRAQVAACTAVAEFFGKTDGGDLYENYFRSGRRGFESHENIRDYLVDYSLPVDGRFLRACALYESVKVAELVPYETVHATLAELRNRGLGLAVITDAHSRDATRRLEKTGLLAYFDGMVSFDMVMVKKPAPEPFLVALDMMKSEPGSTLLIGDSPHRDIRPAKTLGMRTVYARYGDRFSQEAVCPDADFSIDRMDELLRILPEERGK